MFNPNKKQSYVFDCFLEPVVTFFSPKKGMENEQVQHKKNGESYEADSTDFISCQYGCRR